MKGFIFIPREDKQNFDNFLLSCHLEQQLRGQIFSLGVDKNQKESKYLHYIHQLARKNNFSGMLM